MSKEKQIEELTNELVFTSNYGTCNAVANYLVNKNYCKQEWISVDERLPYWSDGKVLVFTKYGFSVCERTVNGRWKGQHANWITHWMPLPEAPKMKGGAE